MNKKGFTLIELLSVIIILAIILVIAVPQTLKLLNSSSVNIDTSNNQMVLKSAELFIANNTSYLPSEIGSTSKIEISELIENKFLKEFKSNNNDCDGYVLITKTNSENYTYTPHLFCGITEEENKLVLHYKFDDFQEPTQNLLFSPYEGEGTHQTHSTFNLEKTINKTVNSNEEYSLSGEFWRNQNHPGRIYAMFRLLDSANVMIPGNSGLVPNWNATIAEPLYRYFENNIRNFAIQNWYHYTLPKITIPSGYDNGTINWIRLMITSGGTIDDVTKFRNVQFEQKPYSTPFVDGIREGIITDYSNNNKTSVLNSQTTPRWLEEQHNGFYQFDGENNHIVLPNDLVPVSKIRSDGITYSAWINTSELKTQRIIGQQIAIGYSDYSSGGLGIDLTGRPQMIAYSDASPSAYVRATANTILETGKWYHLVGTFDPSDNKIRIYVNGELDGEPETIGVFSRLHQNLSNRIGNKHNSVLYSFEGLIDEIRIYERPLNQSEIKVLYNLGR